MSLLLLDYTSKLYPETDLSEFGLIACQHLLGTTVDLFEKLFEKGLLPENTFVIGKCYSTHTPTMEQLKKLGVNVSDDSTTFDPNIDYDSQFQKYTASFAQNALDRLQNKEKIIVLDDGGNLLEYITKQSADQKIFGVEQTTSGYEKLKDLSLQFPVVNIARSRAKLEYESPLVVQTILAEMKNELDLHTETKVLVIGQGAIGKILKNELTKQVTVYGCDKNGEICDFDGKLPDKLDDFDVILGASGVHSLPAELLGRLKSGVRLLSVSSSDREFPAKEIRIASGKVGGKCHDEYVADGIHLLNGGFPINFTGSKHSLPSKHAQLTRSLLLAGICEAVTLSDNGFSELSNLQEEILSRYQEIENADNA